jgi:hypothetical protein
MNFAKMDLGYILGHILGHILPNAFGRPARYVFTFLLQNCIGFVKLLFLNYFRLADYLPNPKPENNGSLSLHQGCQIFLGTTYQNCQNIPNYLKRYQNCKKYSKLSQKIPNGHKEYQIISKDT